MARPGWTPTAERIEQVESYASLGLTKEQIADCMGICYMTLNRREKKCREFSEALKRGQSKGIAMVANELVKNAKVGNVAAQIFFMKARANWTDNAALIEVNKKLDKLAEIMGLNKDIQDGEQVDSESD